MNKILCYTITNFCPYASECIKLLYNSINLNNNINNFDFIVISSKDAPSNFDINTIVDKNLLYDKYVVFLKYSELVPKNYDNYIYLDSDILYFGQLLDLISPIHNFTITKEATNMNHDWFRFDYAPEEHKVKFNEISGINAGSFAYKDIRFLEDIRMLYRDHVKNNAMDNAKLEQSAFNYALASLCDFDLSKHYDISHLCLLHAKTDLIKNKLLYHFCNFANSMENKYKNMKGLYDRYTSS